MRYASQDEIHSFFSATHPEKLRGINWDTREIANDVSPLDKAIITWNCMDEDFQSTEVMITRETINKRTLGRHA